MTTLARRLFGAAALDRGTYEEVEADAGATGQAVAIVLLASLAGCVGLLGLGTQTPRSLIAGIIASLIGWMAWAALTYLIGTRLLPESQTKADLGELLRTIAFASAPGLVRILAILPFVGLTIYAIGSILEYLSDDEASHMSESIAVSDCQLFSAMRTVRTWLES